MNVITVYTQNDCPPCKIVKMFLNEHRIKFQERNITSDQNARKELTENYGAYSTPTVVTDKEVIIGFDLEKLQQALDIK